MEINTETPRLRLRKLEESDRDDIFDIVSDEQTTLDNCGQHAFREKNEKFDELMKAFCAQDRLGVVLKETGRVIGMISLAEDERAVKCYELGFAINKDYRRRGYMYEALKALIGDLFANTDIEMLSASHFPYNEASEKLIKKLGFIYEGIEHKAMEHDELGAVDLVCYYIDKTEE